MTIVDVELSWSRLSSSVSSSDGRKAKATVSAGWQVTHSADATEEEILTGTGINIGTAYPGTTIPCVEISQPGRIGPIYSIVMTKFDGEVGLDGQGQPDVTQTPVNNLPVIDWSTEISNEEVDTDFDGEPITTVNGEAIRGVSADVCDHVLVVTRNFNNYNPHLIAAYTRATNSDTFQSFAPGTGRLIGANAKFIAHSANSYWQVTGRFKFRYPYNTTADKAWYARVLHEGFLAINNDTDVLEHARVNDERVVTPVPLTETGYHIPSTAMPNAAIWLEFKLYGSLPFNALGFL